MKCLNCNNEAVGRSKYCSDRCKVAYNRNNRNSATVTNTTVTDSRNTTVTRYESGPDLVDACGNTHKRVMVDGVAMVYPTLASLREVQTIGTR